MTPEPVPPRAPFRLYVDPHHGRADALDHVDDGARIGIEQRLILGRYLGGSVDGSVGLSSMLCDLIVGSPALQTRQGWSSQNVGFGDLRLDMVWPAVSGKMWPHLNRAAPRSAAQHALYSRGTCNDRFGHHACHNSRIIPRSLADIGGRSGRLQRRPESGVRAAAARRDGLALDTPGVGHAFSLVGFSAATFTNAPNAGAIFVILDPFEKRAGNPALSAAAIQGALFRKYAAIKEAFMVVVAPPPVAGIGNAGGFRMMIEDRAGRGSQALQAAVAAMAGRANQTPGLLQVFSQFETATPQLYLDIDRTKAQMLGINVPDIFNSLQVYLGQSYVNDFNLFGRTFRVQAEADSPYRLRPKDVLSLRVRSSSGETVPLGSFATVRDIAGPYRVPRYNIYPAAELDGVPAPGYSQGQAIEIMQRLAGEVLPDGFGIRMDAARVSADQGRQHLDLRFRARCRVRVPGAGRAI